MSRPSQRAQFKTWFFTSVLRPCREITRVLRGFANDSQYTNKVTSPIAEVRNWVQNLVLNTDKQDSISSIFSRFSDVATWMSNTTTFTPLLNLHFEEYSHCTASSKQMDSGCNMEQCRRKLSKSNEYNIFLSGQRGV